MEMDGAKTGMLLKSRQYTCNMCTYIYIVLEHMRHMHVHVPAHPQNRLQKCHDIYQLLQKIK